MIELIVSLPMAAWFVWAVVRAWRGDRFEESLHGMSTTSTAFTEAKAGWIKQWEKEREKVNSEGT